MLVANEFNGPLQLPINASPSSMPIKLNRLVRDDGGSFKDPAFPCVVGSGGQRQPESVAHFYRSGGEKPDSSPLSDDRGKIVFSCKRDDHFRRTRGMAVHEQGDLPVKWLRAQAFRLKHHGLFH